MDYVIAIEGQQIPIPEEIGKDDAAVKRALAPFFPDAANAMITRTTKDNLTTVTVVKKAGSKGGRSTLGGPLAMLSEMEQSQNTAVGLYNELQALEKADLTPEKMLEYDARLQAAIDAGLQEAEQVKRTIERLLRSPAVPARGVPVGF